MRYEPADYVFDHANQLCEASLRENAILYRLTSVSHNTEDTILNGWGPVGNRQRGRFHQPDQLTTYCSNNVLVSISEVLYHMYRSLLDQLGKASDTNPEKYSVILKQMAKRTKALVVFRVKAIEHLVHLDSEAVQYDYRTNITGTLSVWPDATYTLFDSLNVSFRDRRRRGLYYPSARHSRDKCIALFSDQTERVVKDELHSLRVDLQLIPEDFDFLSDPEKFSPFRKKVHPTMGYYRVVDADKFAELEERGMIHPAGMRTAGVVDFVRRRYSDEAYPADAVTRVPISEIVKEKDASA